MSALLAHAKAFRALAKGYNDAVKMANSGELKSGLAAQSYAHSQAAKLLEAQARDECSAAGVRYGGKDD